MVQIRNVPPELHRKLKARAALEGMSLSEYLLREIRKAAERPTVEEMKRRLEELPPVRLRISPAAIIREERNRR
jgi:antitoxin FitA